MSKKGWILTGVVIAAVAAFVAFRTFERPAEEAITGSPGQPAEHEDAEDAADSSDEFFARLKVRENALLARDGAPSVSRTGPSLKVLMTHGAPLEFKDCFDCGPEGDVEHYLLERSADPEMAVIYRQFYEGDDEVLISSDGTKHDLPAWPVLSPAKDAFVVVSASDAFNWVGLQLWEKSGAHFEKKFIYEPKDYEMYNLLGWKNGDRVELEYSTRTPAGEEKCVPAALIRKAGTWKLDKKPEAGKPGFCPNPNAWLPDFLKT